MSDHGANSVLFNKEDKDWTSRTIGTPNPQPATPPPPPSEWASYVHHYSRDFNMTSEDKNLQNLLI